MSKKNNSGKFWPYMILGFLAIGITLGYWTIKNTISLPVHESNEFMQKYQSADKNANEISDAAAKFDSKYSVELSGLERSNFKPKNLKRKPHKYYKLNSVNDIKIIVKSKDGSSLKNIKLIGLLTRPQTELDDVHIKGIQSNGNGTFDIKGLKVKKPGRYILRLKLSDKDAIKYIDYYGFKDIK